MPELPEVETTKRGIAPYIENQSVRQLLVREARLRWPIAPDLAQQMVGQLLLAVERRGKYLLLHFPVATLIVHLGMSGHLRILQALKPPGKHDHVDIIFANGTLLRYNDPRRFGSMHWSCDWQQHPLLLHLGPEPLHDIFDGNYLWRLSRQRKMPVKHFIMTNSVVVGIGNIYANEALFAAGIHPMRAAGRISSKRYQRLAYAIKTILRAAIKAGGVTLKDFLNHQGKPGYFSISLKVYGRHGQPCLNCARTLQTLRAGNRPTAYCQRCQT